MSRPSRYDHSVHVIQTVLRDVPKGTDRQTCERLLFDHYPYGERAYHPYRAWRRAVNDCLNERAKFDAFCRTDVAPTPLECLASSEGATS